MPEMIRKKILFVASPTANFSSVAPMASLTFAKHFCS